MSSTGSYEDLYKTDMRCALCNRLLALKCSDCEQRKQLNMPDQRLCTCAHDPETGTFHHTHCMEKDKKEDEQ
uniref:Uncharacterized protein n=1 Tax=Anopheles gambiae TaxID=7165 RepID=A0A903XXP0_ANOGA